jgi:thiamine pyrophosphate-dependent acetolactate synthase large subunit-like protein
MKRIDALRVIGRVFAEYPLVVTCGATAREFASLGPRAHRLPLLDSMGLTCAVGLGVALGYPGPVGVIDGDGSLLMGFSVLPTLATVRPVNLTVIVLDNGQHASADEMASQAATFDLEAAIRGCAIPVMVAKEEGSLADSLSAAATAGQLSVIVADIEPGNAPGIPLLLEDPAVIADRFSRAINAKRLT